MRVFTTDQKRWLIDLRDKNPGLKQLRLAQEFQDKVGGDLLSGSTVRDWLKPDAVMRVYTPDMCKTRGTCVGRTEQPFPVVLKV